MKRKDTIKAYLCGIGWSFDLPTGANGVRIYTSLEALKRDRTCLDDCGIVQNRST